MTQHGCSANYDTRPEQDTFEGAACRPLIKQKKKKKRGTMPIETPTGSQHHKPITLAAVKTNTLTIEREVKEKFALSPLNTSGCW